jgi:hypothetical protein
MMPAEAPLGSTLYRAPEAFYLIPDDVTPAPGPLEIRALSGAAIEVDPLSVARFRVTESIARIHAKHAVTTVAARLEHTVHEATKALDSMSTGLQGDVPASAIEDLSAQLQGLVSAFQSADLTTDDGRAAVERQLSDLQRVKDKSAAEAAVAQLHQSAGELLAGIDTAPDMDPVDEGSAPDEAE